MLSPIPTSAEKGSYPISHNCRPNWGPERQAVCPGRINWIRPLFRFGGTSLLVGLGPVFVPMAHSNDEYFTIVIDSVNNQVRLDRVNSDRGVDLHA